MGGVGAEAPRIQPRPARDQNRQGLTGRKMKPDCAVIELRPEQFGAAESVLARWAGLTASTFCYRSGVAGLRIANAVGYIDPSPLPRASRSGTRNFSGDGSRWARCSRSRAEPRTISPPTARFFIHCGATAMGNPGPTDTPPAPWRAAQRPYQRAALLIGSDEDGAFMGLTGFLPAHGRLQPQLCGAPDCPAGAGESRHSVELSIRNMKHTPMELMYLAHINFRPVDGAVLVDAVPSDLAQMHVRTAAAWLCFADAPRSPRSAAEGHRAAPEDSDRRAIEPELVMALDYGADESGWAQSMQVLPDGRPILSATVRRNSPCRPLDDPECRSGRARPLPAGHCGGRRLRRGEGKRQYPPRAARRRLLMSASTRCP